MRDSSSYYPVSMDGASKSNNELLSRFGFLVVFFLTTCLINVDVWFVLRWPCFGRRCFKIQQLAIKSLRILGSVSLRDSPFSVPLLSSLISYFLSSSSVTTSTSNQCSFTKSVPKIAPLLRHVVKSCWVQNGGRLAGRTVRLAGLLCWCGLTWGHLWWN